MLAVVSGKKGSDPYIQELLTDLGIPFRRTEVQSLKPDRFPLCLLHGNVSLSRLERDLVRHYVFNGGVLIGSGADFGIDDLFGVATTGRLTSGWIKKRDHPIGNGLLSSLHVFGGVCARAKEQSDRVATIVNEQGDEVSDAIVVRKCKKGWTIFVAPDLPASVLHIQQGLPVMQDGQPAPDGSAPIDDGILKAEDGLVLHWIRDRIEWNGLRFFGYPVADELRILFLQILFFAASQKAAPLPLIPLWANGKPALGLISHDTDGNDPELARALLEEVKKLRIATTWCIIYPGGYPKDLYRAIRSAGGEIALHFDALTDTPSTRWSISSLRLQFQWLVKETGVCPVSNKNHYTRWEGRIEFFRWCQRLGIQADQSKGPSKPGTIGFLFGGSHPWRPFDDRSNRPSIINVWSLNLLTQDLVVEPSLPRSERHPIMVSADFATWLIDQVVRVGGLAHFLFHPAHIKKPGTALAMKTLVEWGREKNLDWRTSAEIAHWLSARSDCVRTASAHRTGSTWTLRIRSPLQDGHLLTLAANPHRHLESSAIYLHGFPFRLIKTSLRSGDQVPL